MDKDNISCMDWLYRGAHVLMGGYTALIDSLGLPSKSSPALLANILGISSLVPTGYG